jgi:hypothetical protein
VAGQREQFPDFQVSFEASLFDAIWADDPETLEEGKNDALLEGLGSDDGDEADPKSSSALAAPASTAGY